MLTSLRISFRRYGSSLKSTISIRAPRFANPFAMIRVEISAPPCPRDGIATAMCGDPALLQSARSDIVCIRAGGSVVNCMFISCNPSVLYRSIDISEPIPSHDSSRSDPCLDKIGVRMAIQRPVELPGSFMGHALIAALRRMRMHRR